MYGASVNLVLPPRVPVEDLVADSDLDALEFKASVKAATTANITLEGEQTIDGVALTAGDRVLAKNQSTASENGIYIVAAYAWTRATDMAAGSDASASFCFVREGSTQAGTGWLCTSDRGSAVVGTNDLAFAKFTA